MTAVHGNGSYEAVKMMISLLMITREKSICWDTNKAQNPDQTFCKKKGKLQSREGRNLF